MTEAGLRSSVATWADQYVGIKEGSAEHKAILTIFNNSKLCTRYTMTTKDAWCATTVSAAFIACGLTKIFPCVECSCAKMVTLAQDNKIWQEKDSYTPSVGDVIMYDWDDSGSGDNTGNPDHVGIVYSISGTSFKVIEGNKSDTVGYRDMKVNGKYIRGYITPNYASVATSTNAAASSSNTSTISKTVQFTGYMTEKVTPRTWAGTNYSAMTRVSSVAKNEAVEVCDTVKDTSKADWYYVRIQSKYYGFVPASKVSKTKASTTTASTTTSSSSATATKTTTTKSAPTYTVGKVYTTKVDKLNVRKGAGTKYARITYSGLTSNAKANAYKTGQLKKGTSVTCKATKTVDGDVWMQIPSGWIAAYYDGDTYVG